MALRKALRIRAEVALILIILIAGLVDLERMPPLWWDEGWTLSVARNWVERGHYGQLLDGEPMPPGLAAAFPVVAPIALSFRLLGVGIGSGRLPGVLFTFGALALTYHLANRLYNRSVAIGSLVVLLFMSNPHPIYMGRQALGEMPALFFLLAGYALFLSALRRSPWLMAPAAMVWGISLATKAQVLPFWLVSLLLPLSIALLKRWWKLSAWLAIGLIGSGSAAWLLRWLQGMILSGLTLPGVPAAGLYDITAIVLHADTRRAAVGLAMAFGLPTLLGFGYAAWTLLRHLHQPTLNVDLYVARLALLSLSASWFAWYVLLSAGAERYLFPAVFTGSVFVSVLLHDLIRVARQKSFTGLSHGGTQRTEKNSVVAVSQPPNKAGSLIRATVGARLAIALIALMVPLTLLVHGIAYAYGLSQSASRVAAFLNGQTASNALIETYDSELFFLLNRRYHYPPDQIHVELIRRASLHQAVPIEYDPRAADPDYLVVGPYSRQWRLYDPALASGSFRLIAEFPRYQVYERVR